MRKSNFALRLLPSLAHELKKVSEQEGVSANQFINIAVAEKLAVQRAAQNYFAERAARAVPGRALEILEMAGTNEPEPECEGLIKPGKPPKA
jgi:hypothetical protein